MPLSLGLGKGREGFRVRSGGRFFVPAGDDPRAAGFIWGCGIFRAAVAWGCGGSPSPLHRLRRGRIWRRGRPLPLILPCEAGEGDHAKHGGGVFWQVASERTYSLPRPVFIPSGHCQGSPTVVGKTAAIAVDSLSASSGR